MKKSRLYYHEIVENRSIGVVHGRTYNSEVAVGSCKGEALSIFVDLSDGDSVLIDTPEEAEDLADALYEAAEILRAKRG